MSFRQIQALIISAVIGVSSMAYPGTSVAHAETEQPYMENTEIVDDSYTEYDDSVIVEGAPEEIYTEPAETEIYTEPEETNVPETDTGTVSDTGDGEYYDIPGDDGSVADDGTDYVTEEGGADYADIIIEDGATDTEAESVYGEEEQVSGSEEEPEEAEDAVSFSSREFEYRDIIAGEHRPVTVTVDGTIHDDVIVETTAFESGLPEDGVEVLYAYDIEAYHGESVYIPDEPFAVTVRGDRIWNAAEEGREILVYRYAGEDLYENIEEDDFIYEEDADKDTVKFAVREPGIYVIAARLQTRTLTASDDREYSVSVTCHPDANIPSDAVLSVYEVTGDSFEACVDGAAGVLDLDPSFIADAKVLELSIVDPSDPGTVYTPASPVNIEIGLTGNGDAGTDTHIVQIGEKSGEIAPDAADEWSGTAYNFDTESLDVLVVAETLLEASLEASDGAVYRVTATFGPEAGIPADAELSVSEVYSDEYLSGMAEAWGLENAAYVQNARFLDISFVYNGGEIQPAAPVSINVELLEEAESEGEKQVVHFGPSGPEEVLCMAEGQHVDFTAESFSVYGFGSKLQTVAEEEAGIADVSLLGLSQRTVSLVEDDTVKAPEEGIEIVKAFSIEDTEASALWLEASLKSSDAITEKENVSICRVENSEVADVLANEINTEKELLELDPGTKGIAVVKDTGFRHMHLTVSPSGGYTDEEGYGIEGRTVTIDGLMPKDASVTAEDVTGSYEYIAPDEPEAFTDGENIVNVRKTAGTAGMKKASAKNLMADATDKVAEEDVAYTDETGGKRTVTTDPFVVAAYDISILDGDDKYQPGKDRAVTVEITDERISGSADLTLWHIPDEGGMEQVEISEKEDGRLCFSASGFSVYAIVQGPETVEVETEQAATLEELESAEAANGLLFSVEHVAGTEYYFKNRMNSNGTLQTITTVTDASPWYLEKVANTNNRYYIYTMMNGARQYMWNDTSKGANNIGLSDTARADFEISAAGGGRFYFKIYGTNKWLQYSNGGNGIRFWTDANNAGNSKIAVTYASSLLLPDDAYQMDGKTYGLMFYNNEATGEALAAEAKNGSALKSQSMIVRTNPQDRDESLYVAQDSDITMWTFHNVYSDRYTLSANVNGTTVYLRMDENGLTLTDEAGASEIILVPGTGNYEHMLHLYCNGYAVSYEGANGFKRAASNQAQAKQYLHLVDLSELEEDDFVIYSASKVSVSDEEKVFNGARIIVYTRTWDPETKRYVFYAIDHDGSLVPCYESGDAIEWVGTKINTLLWNFTEYYWEGTSDPNYYYELKNPYSGKFIAPQIGNGQILADEPIGINLNGRRYGDYYSQIVAWDDPYYAYAGLKVENGHIVSCPMSETDDFYFAVMQDRPDEDELVTVPTVDHTQYGITMKLVDFGNNNTLQNTFLGSDVGGAVTTTVDDLLSTDLKANGYPTATNTNRSLAELYAGATEVNNLFIGSTYSGTGYYEFDSTQNFASLQSDNNFKVYKELGTTDLSNKPSLKHGQFFPYDDLDPSRKASINGQNLYTATLDLLPESDPRRYEQMYLVSKPNYYFGVEIEASFVQTPGGVDAWGHDIIYEFTGDDDFWLYVDDELIIDLGGIHSALPGSVNYCTGEVSVNGHDTTLYEVFESNYRKRGMSDSAIAAKLDELFEQNDHGQYVFREYTTHHMKIFFMERGGGASNLHMRFNLSSVKPGQIILNKQISGTEKRDYKLAEYAFQIYCQTEEDGDYELLDLYDRYHKTNVTYYNTNIPVKFMPHYTPAGGTEVYDKVFFLTPEQTAVISVPDETLKYKIRECGVNTQVYDEVYANNVELTGEATADSSRKDFETTAATVHERKKVVYTNHVSETALRTLRITKKLYDIENNLITDDPTGFNFRLYLGNENDTDVPAAALQDYHVRNSVGEYCRWNAGTQSFVSLHKDDYDTLTAAERQQATFQTSFNGAISKIPAGYQIEVREVMVGTRFRVEERGSELPAGYSFIEYVRDAASYIIEDGDTINSGIVRENDSPAIEVHNRRGFGLTVKKVWSDASFMDRHGDIFVAVYVNGNLLPGTVKRIQHPRTSAYYYWDTLDANASDISDYVVREVVLSGEYTVDEDTGIVTGGTVTPLTETDVMTIPGKAKADEEEDVFDYHPTYAVGDITGYAHNTRTDTLTNSRHGLQLIKTDWAGHPLPSAVFTLTDTNGHTVGADTYTSDSTGLITTAYLNTNTDYILTETKAPNGYHGLEQPIRFRLNTDGTIVVTQSDWYSAVNEHDDVMGSITVKNRPYDFKAVKIALEEDETSVPLPGAVFALYREVTVDGVTRIDYTPMDGYDNLVSRSPDGLIPKIMQTLPKGAYYLKEKAGVEGYRFSDQPVRFTLDQMGVVTAAESEFAELTSTIDAQGALHYTLNMINPVITTADLTVTKTVDGLFADRTKLFTFTITVDGAEAGDTFAYSGTRSGTITMGTGGKGTFSLRHGERIVIEGLPLETDITVSELADDYTAGWTLGSAQEVSGQEFGPFRLEEDETLDVVNTHISVAPTDYTEKAQPFAILLLSGLALAIAGAVYRKKRRKA